MREPFFNDISTLPLCQTVEELKGRILKYASILKFCGSLGFFKVRHEKPLQQVALMDNYTLHQYIAEHGQDEVVKLIQSMVRIPYLDEDSPEEDRFVNTTIKLKRDGEEVEAEGLACAYLSEGFAVGLSSCEYWSNNHSFTLTILDQSTGKSKENQVYCISELKQFEIDEFIRWAVDTLPLKFRDSRIKQANKKKSLRNDHGKDVLEKFADRILKEPYIIEVINSLPFNPKAKDMIKDVSEDGLIQLVLNHTDKGLGMVIKTTAESRMEALYQAAYIRKKYQ